MDKRIIAGAVILAALAACGGKETAPTGAEPHNGKVVRQGQALYAEHCAACHGAKLEGQADWRRRKPDGRLPAPPHDESGHTWHHPDELLFAIVKNGVVPPLAPEGYQSDMPGFGGKLSDGEIWAVLSYIESTWPEEVWQARREMQRDSGR